MVSSLPDDILNSYRSARPAPMVSSLPDDILYLICNELRYREDWTTLFNLAATCQRIAPLALSQLYRFVPSLPNSNACSKCFRDLQPPLEWKWLYARQWPSSSGWDVVHKDRCALHGNSLSMLRIQKSPGGDDEAEGQLFQSGQLVQRWSIYWRSICMASVGKAVFPYHSYLRMLDLRDLKYLLEDSKFGGRIQKIFFSGELAQFYHDRKLESRKGRKYVALDILPIIDDIGSAIVSKNHILEQISGEISSDALLKWAPDVPRLKYLELYDGNALADPEVHKAIYKHCPQLETLSIFQWAGIDSDQRLGSFISGLPSQTLRELVTISGCGVSLQTCTALNNHAQSLQKLELNFGSDAIPALSLLKACTNVKILHLGISATVDMAVTHKEVLQELIDWLTSCHNLREITLTEFKCGPTILTPILLSEQIHLEELSLNALRNLYTAKDHREFHLALAHQKTLKSLDLRGNAEEMERDDIDAVVDSVNQLVNLQSLKLRGLADYFGDAEIIRCLAPLTNLEEVYIGGWNVTDSVLTPVASLTKLRTVNFAAVTAFTRDGLLRLVDQLGSGHDGFHLSIDNADPASMMSEEEVKLIHESLYAKVGGTLDYLPLRDPDITDFDESDSD